MSDAQVFGKYRLVRRLAFGGMAEIFLARLVGDQGFEKTLVLKRILPQFSSDPDFTRMFVDEAVLAARLTHPNVAQVYDFGEVDGIYFITMELVDGADLRRVVRGAFEKGRGLSPVEVAVIGEGMARGLAYVHALETEDGRPLGIIHRDISPHNVMLTRGGDVKIMDFGIAKAAARATHTATGTIKGKLAYMAPEQALAEEIDQRSDQYAVGLTLWECLVGRRVFEGDSEPELMSRVAAGRVRDLRTERADVPEELARIVMRMLGLKREDRYPHMRDVEQELARFRFGLGAAGAVRLSGIVDEVVPKEVSKPAVVARGTAVLPGPEGSQPSSPSRPSSASSSASAPSLATQELSMESGWSAPGKTEATRAATPEEVAPPAPPTLIMPKRSPKGLWVALVVGVALAATALATIAARTLGDRRATLTIASEPAGAALWLEDHGTMLATGLVTPATLPDRSVGEKVRYRLELAGHMPVEQVVEVTQAEQRGRVVLEAIGKGDGVAGSEEPRADQPAADKPSADRPIADTPMTDGPMASKPIAGQPTTDGAMADKPIADQPMADGPMTDKPTADRPIADTPMTDRPMTGKPMTDAPIADKPMTARPTADKPTSDGRAKSRSAKADALKGKTGFLSLRLRAAWAEVSLNGKKLGITPLARVEVPAGVITLQLKSPEGVNQTVTVDVPVGEHVQKTIELR